MPWCTYTDPEVAGVGLGAEEARERGLTIDTFVQPLAGVDRAILDGATVGFVTVHVRRGTDRIVGAAVVGKNAGELIGTIALAMASGLGVKDFSEAVFPYPTLGEALRKLGDAYNRTRLTPGVRWLLARWFAWTG